MTLQANFVNGFEESLKLLRRLEHPPEHPPVLVLSGDAAAAAAGARGARYRLTTS